eukprot:jgi/Chlat1/914/Chrsp108S01423
MALSHVAIPVAAAAAAAAAAPGAAACRGPTRLPCRASALPPTASTATFSRRHLLALPLAAGLASFTAAAAAAADILERDLRDGQYFITGDLTPSIFADNCRFKDPTSDVTGLGRYRAALGVLFDPRHSRLDLIGPVRVVEGEGTIEVTWRLQGYLKFPWRPYVEPYTGTSRYTLNEQGLIQTYEETWSITGFEALREWLTPTWGRWRPLIPA